jgi:hypothetical protein
MRRMLVSKRRWPTSATAHPPTKVGADALGPGPDRCAGTCCERYAGKCNAARGNATQCMSRWVASAADLNVACTGVGTLLKCERDKA